MRLPVQRLALCLALSVGSSETQLRAANNVDICEILQHPQTFNGRIVSVRTRVRLTFEDFEVDIPSCSKKVVDQIWLNMVRDQEHSRPSGAAEISLRAINLASMKTLLFKSSTLTLERLGKASMFTRYPRPSQDDSRRFLPRLAPTAPTNVQVAPDSGILERLQLVSSFMPFRRCLPSNVTSPRTPRHQVPETCAHRHAYNVAATSGAGHVC